MIISLADRNGNVKNGKPLSATDPRPGNKPFYINPNCPECGTELVLSNLLHNSSENEIWYDEFMCPVCKDEIYLDWPEEEFISLKKEIEQSVHGLNVDSKKFKSKVPHLTVVDGVAVINPKDSLQKKWFEKFKK